MKLVNESFVRNHIVFDENEKQLLVDTSKLIFSLWQNNQNSNAPDDYLNEICYPIMNGISELLDNYSNEYPNK